MDGIQHIDRRTDVEFAGDTMVARVSAGVRNYEAEPDVFLPIDSNIVVDTQGMRVETADVKLRLSERRGDPIEYAAGGTVYRTNFAGVGLLNVRTGELAYDDPAELPQIIIHDNMITYRNVYDGVDLTYTHRRNGVKQEVVLSEAYRAGITLPEGWAFENTQVVVISEVDTAADVRFLNNAPVFDESLSETQGYVRVGELYLRPDVGFLATERGDVDRREWAVTKFSRVTAGKYLMMYGVDLSVIWDVWLLPGAFVIDPSTVGVENDSGCVISTESATYSTAQTTGGSLAEAATMVGQRHKTGDTWRIYRSFYAFDLSGLSGTATAVKLRQTWSGNYSDSELYIGAYKTGWDGALVVADFIEFNGYNSGAGAHTPTAYQATSDRLHSDEYINNNDADIQFNSTGITDVNSAVGSGEFRCAILADCDISKDDSLSEGDNQFVQFYNPGTAAEPEIILTFGSSWSGEFCGASSVAEACGVSDIAEVCGVS